MSTQDKPSWLSLQTCSQVPSLFVCFFKALPRVKYFLFIYLAVPELSCGS